MVLLQVLSLTDYPPTTCRKQSLVVISDRNFPGHKNSKNLTAETNKPSNVLVHQQPLITD